MIYADIKLSNKAVKFNNLIYQKGIKLYCKKTHISKRQYLSIYKFNNVRRKYISK